jgi:hypothetical protein
VDFGRRSIGLCHLRLLAGTKHGDNGDGSRDGPILARNACRRSYAVGSPAARCVPERRNSQCHDDKILLGSICINRRVGDISRFIAAIVSSEAFKVELLVRDPRFCQVPNTQMQPTVTDKVPFSCGRRAAADLER